MKLEELKVFVKKMMLNPTDLILLADSKDVKEAERFLLDQLNKQQPPLSADVLATKIADIQQAVVMKEVESLLKQLRIDNLIAFPLDLIVNIEFLIDEACESAIAKAQRTNSAEFGLGLAIRLAAADLKGKRKLLAQPEFQKKYAAFKKLQSRVDELEYLEPGSFSASPSTAPVTAQARPYDLWKKYATTRMEDVRLLDAKTHTVNMTALAKFYLKGSFILDKDDLVWLEAESNTNPRAQAILGLHLAFSENAASQSDEASAASAPAKATHRGLELLHKAAAQNDAVAHFLLGVLYSQPNLIVACDVQKAFHHQQAAFNQGMLIAEYAFAMLCFRNIHHDLHSHVKPDEKDAASDDKEFNASPLAKTFRSFGRISAVIRGNIANHAWLVPELQRYVAIECPNGTLLMATWGLASVMHHEAVFAFPRFEVGPNFQNSPQTSLLSCYATYVSSFESREQHGAAFADAKNDSAYSLWVPAFPALPTELTRQNRGLSLTSSPDKMSAPFPRFFPGTRTKLQCGRLISPALLNANGNLSYQSAYTWVKSISEKYGYISAFTNSINPGILAILGHEIAIAMIEAHVSVTEQLVRDPLAKPTLLHDREMRKHFAGRPIIDEMVVQKKQGLARLRRMQEEFRAIESVMQQQPHVVLYLIMDYRQLDMGSTPSDSLNPALNYSFLVEYMRQINHAVALAHQQLKIKKAGDVQRAVHINELGCQYMTGTGYVKDTERALLYFLYAANMGNRDAQFNVAYFLLTEEVAQNKNEETIKLAMKWMRKAAHAGHPTALVILGHFYLRNNMPEQARNFFEVAGDHEHPDGAYLASLMTRTKAPSPSAAVATDDPKARMQGEFEKALHDANKGNHEAQILVAGIYANGHSGIHLAPDLLKAAEWYRIAARGNYHINLTMLQRADELELRFYEDKLNALTKDDKSVDAMLLQGDIKVKIANLKKNIALLKERRKSLSNENEVSQLDAVDKVFEPPSHQIDSFFNPTAAPSPSTEHGASIVASAKMPLRSVVRSIGQPFAYQTHGMRRLAESQRMFHAAPVLTPSNTVTTSTAAHRPEPTPTLSQLTVAPVVPPRVVLVETTTTAGSLPPPTLSTSPRK